ncbi:histidinol-phosphatase HisJ family protein [Anaerotalea alkaliphila]|uniref:Histidinol-phosphatase n=1 Tax=Anaerotalea alkaliphila TaxID=2662126 RepID=A0A7X5HTK7_9FIRM|nr:histidinol-phosphatase HisJ family protein [Anaerotalea alkaliphila]NDL66191.1 histidinol-phosphatase HisJ family protein [Anaerotalea alkaliphila]
MIRSDYHVHSAFSGDCDIPMEEVIQAAIALRMENLCFTDHHDLDFPHPTINFLLDLDGYFDALEKYKEQYRGRIRLLSGIELGMQAHLHKALSDLVRSRPLDFVLASNHLANGLDPYERTFFEGRSQSAGYLAYFEDMLYNVQRFQDYDSYGHLDYVVRYGLEEDKKMVYRDFQDVLDEILKTIVSNGKGIELNTSGYRYKLDAPHPNPDILRRYRELGGETITLGSDAHNPRFLLNRMEQAADLLRSLGYRHYAVFHNRKPTYLPL